MDPFRQRHMAHGDCSSSSWSECLLRIVLEQTTDLFGREGSSAKVYRSLLTLQPLQLDPGTVRGLKLEFELPITSS